MNFLDLIKTSQRSQEQQEQQGYLSKAINEAKTKQPSIKAKPVFVPNSAILTDDEYFATLNPKTQMRFDIPMLMGDDTQYFVKYVTYMKLRQSNPEEFNQIMEWN